MFRRESELLVRELSGEYSEEPERCQSTRPVLSETEPIRHWSLVKITLLSSVNVDQPGSSGSI